MHSYRFGLALLLAAACTEPATHDKPSSSGKAQAPEDLPASKQLLGTWILDLNQVPDSALTEEFRKLKQQGKASQMHVEYRFTETDFRLFKTGAGGTVRMRWHYQILNEVGNRLELERVDEDGTTKKISVTFKEPNLMVLGTGSGMVPLTRKH